mmetsp:Transcript_66202/g.149458  ORF Transcript_66202/g.149458 Transcript_66202/m.149458 type:complete len:221 (+) Transcript_66202:191-853(+)
MSPPPPESNRVLSAVHNTRFGRGAAVAAAAPAAPAAALATLGWHELGELVEPEGLDVGHARALNLGVKAALPAEAAGRAAARFLHVELDAITEAHQGARGHQQLLPRRERLLRHGSRAQDEGGPVAFDGLHDGGHAPAAAGRARLRPQKLGADADPRVRREVGPGHGDELATVLGHDQGHEDAEWHGPRERDRLRFLARIFKLGLDQVSPKRGFDASKRC